MKQSAYKEFIGRPEVSFWFPILASAVTIALSFSALKNDISLLKQQNENIIANQQELSREFRDWKSQAETRLGVVESRQGTVISFLENHLGVRVVK